MPNVKNTPSFLPLLKKKIIETLQGSGIKAEIRSEPVPGTSLFRLAVLSPQFKAMSHSERQSLVWRIVDFSIPQEDQMRISMILTLTEDEANGK